MLGVVYQRLWTASLSNRNNVPLLGWCKFSKCLSLVCSCIHSTCFLVYSFGNFAFHFMFTHTHKNTQAHCVFLTLTTCYHRCSLFVLYAHMHTNDQIRMTMASAFLLPSVTQLNCLSICLSPAASCGVHTFVITTN